MQDVKVEIRAKETVKLYRRFLIQLFNHFDFSMEKVWWKVLVDEKMCMLDSFWNCFQERSNLLGAKVFEIGNSSKYVGK